MKLLVGLGNPGKEHIRDRHNLGFLVIDAWAKKQKTEFNKTEFQAFTARTQLNGQEVLLLKPQTFMNRSGEAIAAAMNFFKIPLENLIVLHDELDIPPMSFRIKRGGGPGGHNGLKSILPFGEEFLRFRLGIGRPPHPDFSVADYVLGSLNNEEWQYWEKNVLTVIEAIDLCLEDKVELAMNRFNRR